MSRVRLALAGAAMAGGCVLMPSTPQQLPLLGPSSLGAERSATQVLHAEMDGHKLTLQCAVQADATAVTLIALGPLGSRAFTLHYDGHTLDAVPGPYAPPGLPAERVLADVQLALWPLSAWEQQLQGSDWQLAEPQPGLRRLSYRKRLVAEVRYSGVDPWSSPLTLTHFPPGAYALDIEPQPP